MDAYIPCLLGVTHICTDAKHGILLIPGSQECSIVIEHLEGREGRKEYLERLEEWHLLEVFNAGEN